MKKFLIVASLFALASCVHPDQKVRVELTFKDAKSNIGNNVKVDLAVFDDRLETQLFGSKEFCDGQKINLINEQNLTRLLKDEISDQLSKKGFKQGSDKFVEIHIKQLKYKADCGFLLGKSRADILAQVLTINPKTGTKTTKNFELSSKNKHLILPLASTDAEIINELLEEMVGNILNDDIIVRN